MKTLPIAHKAAVNVLCFLQKKFMDNFVFLCNKNVIIETIGTQCDY